MADQNSPVSDGDASNGKKKVILQVTFQNAPILNAPIHSPALPSVDLPSFNIPRKSRYSKSIVEHKPQSQITPLMSTFEAASILLQMSRSRFEPSSSQQPMHNKLTHAKRERFDPNVKNEEEEEDEDFTPPLITKNKKTTKTNRVCSKMQNQPRRKRTQSMNELILVPNDMPAAMRDKIGEMGGYGIDLVIQKKLEDTDINKNHGRLSLPVKKLRSDFLTDEEKMKLSGYDESNKLKGMKLRLLDQLLRENTISLKQWKIGSSYVYCLMTHWNSFVKANSLEAGDYIQLWSFRINCVDVETGIVGSEICLAIVKLEN